MSRGRPGSIRLGVLYFCVLFIAPKSELLLPLVIPRVNSGCRPGALAAYPTASVLPSDSILRRVLVAVLAMSPGSHHLRVVVSCSLETVHPSGNGFEVLDVAASSVPAEVVNVVACWDLALDHHPHRSMGLHCLDWIPESPIPVGVESSLKIQAAVFIRNQLRHKAGHIAPQLLTLSRHFFALQGYYT